jgi:ABC-type Fe3+/spermidine/putrescine transport system ATPase subunit
MRRGRLAQVDTPTEVFHRSADSFVASFMGEADELRRADARRLAPTDARGGDDVLIVRPDDLAICAVDGADRRVTAVEYRGAVWCCTVELSGGSRVRALHVADHAPDVGAQVNIVLRDGHRLLRAPRSADEDHS